MRVFRRALILWGSVLIGFAGCHQKAPKHAANSGNADAGAAGADTGEGPASPIGAGCYIGYNHCEAGECRNTDDYGPAHGDAWGFCSRTCAEATDCPSGFRCTQTAKDKLCLPRCADEQQCERFVTGWKCAEAQGDRVCANSAARGGEIVLRTQLVIDSVGFGKVDQAWRFVPGVSADVTLSLINKGSSGPVKGMGVMSSVSKWVEVGASSPDGSWKVRTRPGVPVGEPQQLNYKVADPIGTGSVDVPFFIRSLTSGLQLTPTIGFITDANTVSVSGTASGFGTAPALVNTLNDAAAAPWAMTADPWLADQSLYVTMGTVKAPGAILGNSLALTISEPTGSSWPGPIRVVPNFGPIFAPEPVLRSELATGKPVYRGVPVKVGGTSLGATSDQPWAALTSPTVGPTGAVALITTPKDPGSARAWITLTWNEIVIARVPIIVLPDLPP